MTPPFLEELIKATAPATERPHPLFLRNICDFHNHTSDISEGSSAYTQLRTSTGQKRQGKALHSDNFDHFQTYLRGEAPTCHIPSS